jgi:GNAT superfamily N-acetyltransferase
MNHGQRAAFRDKMERYARKPDRALILAVNGPRVLGLICVIHRAKFSFALPDSRKKWLQEFASITQLFVHSAMRQRGIGSSLYLQAEQWARDRHRAGIWLVTHRMAAWYQGHFGYEEILRIRVKTVEKIVLAKEFV